MLAAMMVGVSDLLNASTGSLFTVVVRDFKQSADLDGVTLHGAFTTYPEAEAFAAAIMEAYPDFIEAKVAPLQSASVFQVNQAQRIGWVPSSS